jgi:hypothetical protein
VSKEATLDARIMAWVRERAGKGVGRYGSGRDRVSMDRNIDGSVSLVPKVIIGREGGGRGGENWAILAARGRGRGVEELTGSGRGRGEEEFLAGSGLGRVWSHNHDRGSG